MCKTSRLFKLIKSIWLSFFDSIGHNCLKVSTPTVSKLHFHQIYPMFPPNFSSTLHRQPFQYALKKQAVHLPTKSASFTSLTLPPLPHFPPIFCLSHHQTKISVMKTSAGQLVRGLEMEIEKLKGSERSVCARITAHFITGRNRQIWHRIERKKTLSAVYFWPEQQQRSVISASRGTVRSAKMFQNS